MKFGALILATACAACTPAAPPVANAPVAPAPMPEALKPTIKAPAAPISAAKPAATPAPIAKPTPIAKPATIAKNEPVPVVATAKADAGPHLDLKTLEARLKETSAIGTFTKLSLKNSVDDLLGNFRAYHAGKTASTTPLRQQYELLMMKVLSLLQNDDPRLADDIARSRETIWSVLADKARFSTI